MSGHKRSRPSAGEVMSNLGLQPDPWQIEVLDGGHQRVLLNCCRQAGKSTAVAMLGVVEAIFQPFTKVLLVSRSHRQSMEVFRIVTSFFRRLGSPLKMRETNQELELSNHSRVVSLPCREETIRGYSDVSMLIIDEAARVPDDLYRAVRPMLAVSNGRMICMSTPYGKRGFFYEEWAKGDSDWKRIEIPADKISRIRPEFLDKERRAMGESWYRQEYCCSFEALEGLVYVDFGRCVVEELPEHVMGLLDPLTPVPSPPKRGRGENGSLSPLEGRGENRPDLLTARSSPPEGRGDTVLASRGQRFGGIDFGLRNPFAAVWGTLDRDGVLWLTGEHFSRDKSLGYHAKHLPRDVTWFGDPAGAREIRELICAGLAVRAADNQVRPGIQAVRARLENGTLRILKGACPNLLSEAALYRYDPESRDSETPLKEYDHAMDALRYLVSKLDAGKMARFKRGGPAPVEMEDHEGPVVEEAVVERWASVWNEELWTRISPWSVASSQ